MMGYNGGFIPEYWLEATMAGGSIYSKHNVVVLVILLVCSASILCSKTSSHYGDLSGRCEVKEEQDHCSCHLLLCL